MNAQSIYEVVEGYGIRLGAALAPHDLRRSFAKLAHKGRAPLEQIQISLGLASIQTTERYLGIEQDLTDAPCDHLGIRAGGNRRSPREPRAGSGPKPVTRAEASVESEDGRETA
jgi:integrase